MESKVGRKGQVVIEKRIREALGIEPGSIAIQRIVDGHVEIHFIREHNESLAGILAPYITRHPADEDWHAEKEAAWESYVRAIAEGWAGTAAIDRED